MVEATPAHGAGLCLGNTGIGIAPETVYKAPRPGLLWAILIVEAHRAGSRVATAGLFDVKVLLWVRMLRHDGRLGGGKEIVEEGKNTRAGGREGKEGVGRAFLKLGQTADYNGHWALGMEEVRIGSSGILRPGCLRHKLCGC